MSGTGYMWFNHAPPNPLQRPPSPCPAWPQLHTSTHTHTPSAAAQRGTFGAARATCARQAASTAQTPTGRASARPPPTSSARAQAGPHSFETGQ
eukprot:152905-Chlamydomonas_euryale.AAC.1